jgi:hypothetical protein
MRERVPQLEAPDVVEEFTQRWANAALAVAEIALAFGVDEATCFRSAHRLGLPERGYGKRLWGQVEQASLARAQAAPEKPVTEGLRMRCQQRRRFGQQCYGIYPMGGRCPVHDASRGCENHRNPES